MNNKSTIEKQNKYINNLFFNKIVGICCHDAGAAEILSSFVKKYSFNFIFYIEGPAIKIFKKKLKNIKVTNKKNFIKKSEVILFGTSTNYFELKLFKSLDKKIYSIFFLDHWSFYQKRFLYKNKYYLPSEIWVSDRYAFDLVGKYFDVKKKIINNPYFDEIAKIKIKNKKKSKYFLYVSSNINNSDFYSFRKFNNITLFHNAIKLIKKLKLKNIINKNINKIIYKPHPTEYMKNIPQINYPGYKINVVSNNESVIKLINNSQFVIGYNSAALVIAKILRIKNFNISSKFESLIPKKYIDNYIDTI
jgi:hypothetical protein